MKKIFAPDVIFPTVIVSLLIFLLWAMWYADHKISWVVERHPETAEERKAVADEESSILEHTPKSLAGHDQDWDDAIKAAHATAIETQCKARLYEYEGRTRTGRMQEINNEKGAK